MITQNFWEVFFEIVGEMRGRRSVRKTIKINDPGAIDVQAEVVPVKSGAVEVGSRAARRLAKRHQDIVAIPEKTESEINLNRVL